MGTRIALLRAGRLVQYDTPETLLAQPADAFVEANSSAADRALKRLGAAARRRDYATPGRAPPDARRVATARPCAMRWRTARSDADVAAVSMRPAGPADDS